MAVNTTFFGGGIHFRTPKGERHHSVETRTSLPQEACKTASKPPFQEATEKLGNHSCNQVQHHQENILGGWWLAFLQNAIKAFAFWADQWHLPRNQKSVYWKKRAFEVIELKKWNDLFEEAPIPPALEVCAEKYCVLVGTEQASSVLTGVSPP